MAALLCAAGFFVSVHHAEAHAIVVASTPAANASVLPGPVEVVVKFNTRIDRARSRLSLEAPGGVTSPVKLVAQDAPTSIGGRAEVTKAGPWTLRWQVLAEDGHITRGEIPFLVGQ